MRVEVENWWCSTCESWRASIVNREYIKLPGIERGFSLTHVYTGGWYRASRFLHNRWIKCSKCYRSMNDL